MSARERLVLPYSKGWVDFIDLDDITGGDLRKIRAARGDNNGETVNAMSAASAVVFVAAWEIPGKDLPIPRRDPLAVEKLHYADFRTLDRALSDLMEQVFNGDFNEGMTGTPPPPATD